MSNEAMEHITDLGALQDMMEKARTLLREIVAGLEENEDVLPDHSTFRDWVYYLREAESRLPLLYDAVEMADEEYDTRHVSRKLYR